MESWQNRLWRVDMIENDILYLGEVQRENWTIMICRIKISQHIPRTGEDGFSCSFSIHV